MIRLNIERPLAIPHILLTHTPASIQVPSLNTDTVSIHLSIQISKSLIRHLVHSYREWRRERFAITLLSIKEFYSNNIQFLHS